MTTAQRSELWSEIRDAMARVARFAEADSETKTYEQTSAKLDKMARELTDKIVDLFSGPACPTCGGGGFIQGSSILVDCPKCNGSG